MAYVYDQSASGSITIYIDGVQDTSQANTRAWSWTATQRIELGRSHDSFWHAYDGELDDFRIYNRLLTADEVMQIATSDALVDARALKVRFNFDAPPDGLALTWPCGTLECTPTLSPTIPWAPVAGAVSPYVINQTAPTGFYRVRR